MEEIFFHRVSLIFTTHCLVVVLYITNKTYNLTYHLIERSHNNTQTCVNSANPVELHIIIRIQKYPKYYWNLSRNQRTDVLTKSGKKKKTEILLSTNKINLFLYSFYLFKHLHVSIFHTIQRKKGQDLSKSSPPPHHAISDDKLK